MFNQQIALHLQQIRQAYVTNRVAFVPGQTIMQILMAMGVKESEFDDLQRVSDSLPPDPTLAFRRSRNGRFVIDFDNRSIKRTEYQPFVLSKEEDFVRHDSGKIREFRGIQDDLQLNAAFQGLLRFKACVIDGVDIEGRPKLNHDSRQWVSTVFNLRTVTTPELLGEPALEGVHSDGVEHTMTTLLGHANMSSSSAETFIHDVREVNGTPNAKANRDLILGKVHHLEFMDTLLIVDNERKHSLTPVHAIDESRSATRDMLIFFTRRPTETEHPTHPYDSLVPHREMPMVTSF